MRIRLPEQPGGEVEVELPGGDELRRACAAPSDRWRAAALWQRLVDDWEDGARTLEVVGAELADWLFDAPARAALATLAAGKSADGQRRTPALHVPDWLSDFPWEAALVPELGGPLGVSGALSVFRAGPALATPAAALPSQLRMVLVAAGGGLPSVAREAEEVRKLVAANPAVDVKLDAVARWDRFSERFAKRGADILHFAGHGLDDGEGLCFSDAEVNAGRIANLLAGAGGCRLAVLNACTTAAAPDRTLRPFGGLAQRLSTLGVPAVIASPAPLPDDDGRMLARRLYGRLASGDSVDLALQQAREELFNAGKLGWAFVQLVVRGAPAALLGPALRASESDVRRRILGFGFDEQRAQLRQLLLGKRSLVIVIPGVYGSGHRHLVEQVHHEIEDKHDIWAPIRNLDWGLTGEAALDQESMLGAIAAALELPSSGSHAQLRARIIEHVRAQGHGRALVVDVNEMCLPSTRAESVALCELVHEVWAKIVAGLAPVTAFLLLPIVHPLARDRARWSRDVVKRLAKEPRPSDDLWIEVLDELGPIEKSYVQRFLQVVTRLDDAAARSQASSLTKADNNKMLIDALEHCLARMEGLP